MLEHRLQTFIAKIFITKLLTFPWFSVTLAQRTKRSRGSMSSYVNNTGIANVKQVVMKFYFLCFFLYNYFNV